jgi:hypothetical protein
MRIISKSTRKATRRNQAGGGKDKLNNYIAELANGKDNIIDLINDIQGYLSPNREDIKQYRFIDTRTDSFKEKMLKNKDKTKNGKTSKERLDGVKTSLIETIKKYQNFFDTTNCSITENKLISKEATLCVVNKLGVSDVRDEYIKGYLYSIIAYIALEQLYSDISTEKEPFWDDESETFGGHRRKKRSKSKTRRHR